MKKSILLLFLGFCLLAGAETLEEKLSRFGEENGSEYVKPFVNAMSANLNSGLFTSAKVMKPFRFGVFINTSIAFIPSEAESFLAKRPDVSINGEYLYEEEEIKSATVFGDNGNTFHLNSAIPDEFTTEEMDIKLPDGLNTNVFPQFYPQFHFGLPAGNELMLRYFPKITVDKEIGDLAFWGIGLKHSLNYSILRLIPIDLALQFVYQNVQVGDVIDIKSTHINAQISKKLLMWTFYGGIGLDYTKLSANYETEQFTYNEVSNQIESIPIDIDFEIENDSPIRANFGIRYTMLIVHFYANYTLHKYNIFNAGIGVSL